MIPAWLFDLAPFPAPSGSGKTPGRPFFDKTLTGIRHFFAFFFMAEEQSARRGFLQKLDPRVKLLTIGGGVLLTSTTHALRPLAALYTFTLILAACSQLSWIALLARTWLFVPLFTAAMAFPVMLERVTPGKIIFALGPLAITHNGTRMAAILVLRAATAVSWSLLLVLTTPWTDLLYALQTFYVPQVFILTMQMMIRYLHLLVRQLEELQWALKSRSIVHLKIRQSQGIAGVHAGTLLRRSLVWSEEIYRAMRSRGYRGNVVPFHRLQLERLDYFWMTFCLLTFSFFIYWKS